MLNKNRTTDVTSVFGRTLAALRAAAGLSQTTLGNLIQMDRTTIARLEIGRTTISVPVQTAVEQILIARQAVRQYGDLALLSARVSERLLAQGVTVCLDRPAADAELVTTRTVVLAAETVIKAWAADLRAEGLNFGQVLAQPEAAASPALRLVLTGPRLHTSRARPAEIAQRLARTDAA